MSIDKLGGHDFTGSSGQVERPGTVVVTGGNRGIGLALATGVGVTGAKVVIWARDPRRNDEAVGELEAKGIGASSVICDVGDEGAVEHAMATTVEQNGPVSAFFANAGIGGTETPFVELSLSDWRHVMRINLDGTFLCLREAARHMVANGHGGSLVAVTSVVSRFGAPRKEAYAVTKTGIEALVRSLAVELAPHGIRCNALAPGWVDTEMTGPEGSWSLTDNERLRTATTARTPVRRWGASEDLWEAPRFLADKSLVFHTGDVLVVDGGYSIT